MDVSANLEPAARGNQPLNLQPRQQSARWTSVLLMMGQGSELSGSWNPPMYNKSLQRIGPHGILPIELSSGYKDRVTSIVLLRNVIESPQGRTSADTHITSQFTYFFAPLYATFIYDLPYLSYTHRIFSTPTATEISTEKHGRAGPTPDEKFP